MPAKRKKSILETFFPYTSEEAQDKRERGYAEADAKRYRESRKKSGNAKARKNKKKRDRKARETLLGRLRKRAARMGSEY